MKERGFETLFQKEAQSIKSCGSASRDDDDSVSSFQKHLLLKDRQRRTKLGSLNGRAVRSRIVLL